MASFELDALLALQRLVRTDRRALGMALNALSNSTATPLTQAPRAWAWAVKAFSNGSKATIAKGGEGGYFFLLKEICWLMFFFVEMSGFG